MILVTGGCGFIGSTFILDWLGLGREPALNLELLTNAGTDVSTNEVCGSLAPLANGGGVESVTSGAHRRWVEQQYPSLHPAA